MNEPVRAATSHRLRETKWKLNDSATIALLGQSAYLRSVCAIFQLWSTRASGMRFWSPKHFNFQNASTTPCASFRVYERNKAPCVNDRSMRVVFILTRNHNTSSKYEPYDGLAHPSPSGCCADVAPTHVPDSALRAAFWRRLCFLRADVPYGSRVQARIDSSGLQHRQSI